MLWTLWILGVAALTAAAWAAQELRSASSALPASNADFGFDAEDVDLWALRA